MVFADIELINGEDLVMARKNIIGEEEIRRFPLNILVDSGAHQLVLNENIQQCNCPLGALILMVHGERSLVVDLRKQRAV